MSQNRGDRQCFSNNSIPANDPNCAQRPQVSVFYFVTTVVGMVVLAIFTLLFLFCLFLKRRRLQLRLQRPRGSEMRAFETAVTFYPSNDPTLPTTNPSGTSNGTNSTAAKGNVDGAAPFTCVIMAGESQPTFIAHPIPKTSPTSTTTTTPVDQDAADKQSSSQASNAEVKS